MTWFLDFDVTDHIINDIDLFCRMKNLDNTISISVAKTGQNFTVTHVDEIDSLYGMDKICTIKEVLIVPNLRRNLLSAGHIEKAGLKIVFNNRVAVKSNNGTIIAIG